MKIDLDKSAFPLDKSAFPTGDDFRGDGMTVREELWARFAANPPDMPDTMYPPLVHDYHAWEQQTLIELIEWAIKYANTMIATIAEREGREDE